MMHKNTFIFRAGLVVLTNWGLLNAAQAQEYIPVAAVNFTSSVSTEYRQKLPDLIINKLVNTGEFDVVERDKLTTMVSELDFQSSGLVDPKRAVEVGNMSGARLLVTGNIIDHRSNTAQNTAYKITTTTYTNHLKARMEVIDLERGVKIFSSVADGDTTMKKTGANYVGTSEKELGTIVADKLVAAMMINPRIRRMIETSRNIDEPSMAMIMVSSQPDGADVEVDGVYYGNAGSEIEVPAGLRQISVTLPGFLPWTKKVKVRDGLKFNARLMEAVDQKVRIDVQQSGDAQTEQTQPTEQTQQTQ